MKKVLVLAISSFVLWSCNNSSEKAKSNQETKQEEHQHDETSEAVELNIGKKWIVNDEMKPFVAKGEGLVTTYLQSSHTNYNELAQQLKEQNNQLIKSCTMKGKSHDELHKWLHPHLELVEALGKSTNENEAKGIVLKLQKSNEVYHQYFE
ncbi:MAG: hypothetical protein IPP11_12430 [Chitinophagaceae bacterium]|nr:hypothetical protein [Chitinophagaceae bacterium]